MYKLDLGVPPRKPDVVHDLMPLDMRTLYTQLTGNKSLGLIPLMASCSKGQIGALNAESFCERVLSQSNLVMTDGNTLLSDEEIEMVVILRVNREFMEFMREQQEVTDYLKAKLLGQTHNMTVVTEEDNGDEMCDSVP